MRTVVLCATVIAAVAAAKPATGQSPFSLEVTGAGVVPTQTLGGADLGTGFGLGANLRVRFMPHLSAYGGWELHHNSSNDLITGRTTDVEDTGYTLGLRFEHPLTARTAYWVRAGGLYNHIELESSDGEVISDSGHGIGWEAGAGLAVPVTTRVALTPGVRFRTLSRDLDIAGTTSAVRLSYVTFGTGLAIRF